MAMCCASPRKAAPLSPGGGFDAPPPQRMASQAEQLPTSKLEEIYDMSELLGAGKYGQVHRATSRSPNGLVPQELALKLIDKRVAHSDEANVQREVDIALSVQHPNVVRTYQALETPHHVVLCMQLVDGVDAFEHYSAQAERQGSAGLASEKEVSGHCHDVVQGLQYLHARGIAHRDMKLENIMITKSGRAVVVDFGCAGCVASGDGSTTVGTSVMNTKCGTIEYAAPELLRGSQYGVGCDIWSLGVVAFILLTGGDRPFWDENESKLIKKVSDASGKHKHSFRDASWSKRSLACRGFIDTCLTKDPQHRSSASTLVTHAWMAMAARHTTALSAATVPEAEPPLVRDVSSLSTSLASLQTCVSSEAETASSEEQPTASEAATEAATADAEAAQKSLQARRRFRLAGHTIGAVVRWRSFTESDSIRRELVHPGVGEEPTASEAATEAATAEAEAAQKSLQARRRFRLAGHTIGAVVRWRSFTESDSIRQELVHPGA